MATENATVCVGEILAVENKKLSRVSRLATYFMKLLGENQTNITNVITFLIMIGGEELFEKNIYSCPCTQPRAERYIYFYFFGIFLTLWMLSIAAHSSIWRVCVGCKKNCSSYTGTFCSIIFKAAIIPVAWIYISLMDGDYAACLQTILPCEQNSTEYKEHKATSQVYGWIFLFVSLLFYIVYMSCYRCCNKESFLQEKFGKIYREAEETLMNERIKVKANDLASENVNYFLERNNKTKEGWADASDLYATDEERIYFSSLHQYCARTREQSKHPAATM